ncbi:MAG: hypothetical protein GC185_09915 [Alphaproteobacteria bacterium]|nr:hypothetical protein [Alphaproteobacteria bacterium]
MPKNISFQKNVFMPVTTLSVPVPPGGDVFIFSSPVEVKRFRPGTERVVLPRNEACVFASERGEEGTPEKAFFFWSREQQDDKRFCCFFV